MVTTFEKRVIGSHGYGKSYSIEGKEIKSIVFYDETGILLNLGSYISNVSLGENDYVYTDTLSTIKICKPTRRAKVNLTRQENFYVPTKREYTWQDSKYDLYIYVDNDTVILEKQKETFTTDKNYGRNRVVSTYNVFKLKGEIIQTVYSREDNDKLKYLYDELTLISLKENKNIETNLGKEFDRTKKLLEENNINLEDYYLEKVVRYFNLQKRNAPIDD